MNIWLVCLGLLACVAFGNAEPYKHHRRTRRDDAFAYKRSMNMRAPSGFASPCAPMFPFAPMGPLVNAYGWFPGAGGSNTGGAFQLPNWMPCNCPPDEEEAKGGAEGEEGKPEEEKPEEEKPEEGKPEEGKPEEKKPEEGKPEPPTTPATTPTTPTTPATTPTTPATTPTTPPTTPPAAGAPPAAPAAGAPPPPPPPPPPAPAADAPVPVPLPAGR